jgi:hypothetical protein
MLSTGRLALLTFVLLGQTALAGEHGKPQSLIMHTAHAPPVSLAPHATRLTAGAKTYGGTPIDVLGYHYDNNRTGWNQNETDLTPATVASSNFGLLQTLAVDGNVFAQPLLVSNYLMPDHSMHDVLIVATGHDSVYAFDAQSYALLWQVSLGTSQSTADVGCGDVHPEYGISSTPVIVRKGKKATIYVVAATEPSHLNFQTELHALDLGTGTDIIPPASIAPSATLSNGSSIAFDPQNQWNRASLAFDKDSIYIGIGSHCDRNASNITGWLLRYNTKLNLESAFHTIETPAGGGTELASIWMTGFAPAINASGHVFAVTGNGDFTGKGKDWGESVLALPASLGGTPDRFTAASYNNLNGNDNDFGSGGVMLLPAISGQTAPPLAVAMGKDATLYLLNQTKLGGEKAGDKGALQAQRIGSSGGGVWGGPAFYDSPSAGPLVYYQINGDVLRSYAVASGAAPALTQFATGTTAAGYGGSLPIVSSNGATPGTGIVWLIRRTEPISVEAYGADALGAPIFTASVGNWSNPGQGNAFLTPMQANGRLYLPAYKAVSVFGLTQ